jgi:flagellar hook-basal body complex protein FliE
MDISAISSLASSSLKGVAQSSKTAASTTTASSTNSIGNTFENVLSSLNDSQQNADNLLTKLASGENVEVADVMIAQTENDVNFRVAMAIRDKLVDAYREVMRMSV